MFYNPFENVNWEQIKEKIKRIREEHPEWTNDQICEKLIREKCNWVALSGALTALPSNIPGIGPVITTIGGITVDLSVILHLMTELVLEIAAIYGRKPYTRGTSREAFFVLCSAFGGEAISAGLTKAAVMNASKRVFLRLIQKLLALIGLRVTQKAIARFIPLVGSVINAVVNANMCKMVGYVAKKWYSENPEQDPGWDKEENNEEN